MKRALKWLKFRRSAHHGTTLSFRGAFFVFGTTLIGMASMDAGINLLLMVFGLCLAACFLSFFAGWHSLRRITVRRMVPEAVSAGQPFEIRYAVQNHARWGCARNIHLADLLDASAPLGTPETLISRLRPGESILVSVPAIARQRGRARMRSLRISTQFPFSIFEKSVTLSHEQELIVYPTLGRLIGEVRPVSRATEAAHSGGVPSRIRGDEEYYGVREYRIGDNPRRIHWRRSAQTGQLMVREMAKTRDYKFWCVLDTHVNPRNPSELPRLEAAISAAATTICDALEKGVKVGLICNGDPPVILPPGGGRAHRPRLLRELALRGKNVEADLAAAIQRVSWPHRWRGNCLLFAACDSDALRSAARALNFALGATTVLMPGASAFESLFFIPDWAKRSSLPVNEEAGGPS